MAMAISKVALFFALNLVLIAAVHGNPPVVPTHPLVPSPPPTPSKDGNCSINPLKISVCSNVLLLLKLKINVPETEQCCPLLHGLADLDAAICVCSAIKVILPGIIPINLPVDLSLLLNYCHKTYPSGFTCSL